MLRIALSECVSGVYLLSDVCREDGVSGGCGPLGDVVFVSCCDDVGENVVCDVHVLWVVCLCDVVFYFLCEFVPGCFVVV